MTFNSIPQHSLIEVGLPIKRISELAQKEGNSKRPIYTIHKWWARRLSSVVRALILGIILPASTSEEEFWDAYYQANDTHDLVVLDPFMGGGTCIVEAKKMGAKAVGVDIDPMACFVTKREVEPFDEKQVVQDYNTVIAATTKAVSKFYWTRAGKISAEVVNYFWAYNAECPECHAFTMVHPHYYLAKDKKNVTVFCKHCGHIEVLQTKRKRFKCSRCGQTTDIYQGNFLKGQVKCRACGQKSPLAFSISGADSLKLYAVEYVLDGMRFYKQADDFDQELYDQACEQYFSLSDKLNIPDDTIPISANGDPRPQSHGFLRFKDLFNCRQLYSLGILLKQILSIENLESRKWLLTAFSDCLASNNLLCCYAYDYKKLTPLFGIHAYTVPVHVCENNVIGTNTLGRGTYKKAFQKLCRGKRYGVKCYEVQIGEEGTRKKIFTGEHIEDHVGESAHNFFCGSSCSTLILNENSENLSEIPDASIDIVLTDPPYYDNLAYSELSTFYYSWIKDYIEFRHSDALNKTIYVADQEEKTRQTYISQLSNVFGQCYKKLKPNGIMVFSFHHNKVDAWIALACAIKHSSFLVTNVFPMRSEGSSAYHSSEESIKWDSIIVLRKNTIKIPPKGKKRKDELDYFTSELHLKRCDLVSYYRSIRLMDYVNESQVITDFEQLREFFNLGYDTVIGELGKKEDN